MESSRNASSLLNSAQACLNPQMDPNLVSKLADTKEALTTVINAHNDATTHPSVELRDSANILLDFIEKFEVNSSELYYETPDQVALSACPINLETAHCRFRRHSLYSSQNSADIREHAKNIGIFRHGPPSRHREQPRAVSSLYLEIACSDRILSIVQELRKQVSNLGSNDSDTSSQCAEYEKMLDLFDTSLRARWLLSMSGPL